jgi:TnpA family transposase
LNFSKDLVQNEGFLAWSQRKIQSTCLAWNYLSEQSFHRKSLQRKATWNQVNFAIFYQFSGL